MCVNHHKKLYKCNLTKNRSAVICFSTTEAKSTFTRLPKPNFLISEGQNDDLPKTSVFSNPYIQAENEKQAILEKHVKMVNTKDNLQRINGKKICWNYRKGKCRFGHNCIYAHDSDLQKTKEQLDAENQTQQTVLYQNQSLPQPTTQELKDIQEEAVASKKNRKRPGLTQGLVPGKKVMKNYMKLKK